MEAYKAEIKKFLSSEDNIYLFSMKKISNESVLFSIDDIEFTLQETQKSHFKVSTKELFLESWCENVNSYCSQGKKTIEDVLIKVKILNLKKRQLMNTPNL
jgi:hypothetical protein